MHNTLESYKVFPYVAWALVIGFAVFTYFLTTRLQTELSGIDSNVEDLETRVKQLEERQVVVPR